MVLIAQEDFDDTLASGEKVHRTPGDRWMVHGPSEYIPRIEIGDIKCRYTVSVCVKCTEFSVTVDVHTVNVEKSESY